MSSLDGLRGLGTAILVVTHTNPQVLPGGPLLIGMFFTLSGFIITYLLVLGHYGTPVRPTLFWAQRIRRLLPALVAMLVGTAVMLRLLGSEEQWLVWREDLVAAAAQFYNWHLIWGDSRDHAFLDVSWPTVHLWSLSIEEQFYFIWPLVFLVPVLTRRLLPFLVSLAVVTLAWSFVLFTSGASAERIMWGTDTRIMQIAVGAIGAVLVIKWQKSGFFPPDSSSRPWWAKLGLAIPAAMIISAMFALETRLVVVVAPLVIAAVATLTLIDLSTRSGTKVERVFTWQPLVFLGIISYAMYLWHMPVLWVWRQMETSGVVSTQPLLRLVVVLGISVVLASLSWILIESPALLINPKRNLPRRILLVGALPVLAATGGITWLILAPSPQVQQQLTVAQQWECPEGSPVCDTLDRAQPYSWSCPEPDIPCLLYRPSTSPSARILVGGDTVARGFVPGVIDRARATNWEVWGVTKGCAHTEGRKLWWASAAQPFEYIYGDPEFRQQPSQFECQDWDAALRSYLSAVSPDVYVSAATGVAQGMTFDGSDVPVAWFDPEFIEQAARATTKTIDTAKEYGASVLFVLPLESSRAARCDTSDFVLGCPPDVYYGSGPSIALEGFVFAVEQAVKQSGEPSVATLDLDELVCDSTSPCPATHSGMTWRPDGHHFSFSSGLLVGEEVATSIENVLRERLRVNS